MDDGDGGSARWNRGAVEVCDREVRMAEMRFRVERKLEREGCG